MTLTKQQGIVLVTEQQAERALLDDGFQKNTCCACRGSGHFSLGTGSDWKKYTCYNCAGAGWLWKSPPPDPAKGAPAALTLSK